MEGKYDALLDVNVGNGKKKGRYRKEVQVLVSKWIFSGTGTQ